MDLKKRQFELSFTEIRVADWPRAVRWYVEVLGLHPALNDEAHQFTLLETGAGRLALKAGTPPTGSTPNVRLVFQVSDVDEERARLAALGVEVGPASDHLDEGYRQVRLVDPEGTPITLFSWRSSAPP
jgi:predicted enzyme related to lactoylglutathione lyase